MKVQLIRNATLKLEYAGKTILVDPMLAPKDTFDPFAGIARNPTVDLKSTPEEVLANVDLVLVTHTHPDHFDPPAIAALDKQLPLFCQPVDENQIKEHGFLQTKAIEEVVEWEGIKISRTGGKHGSGEVLQHMGTVSGFVLQAEGIPTLYIVGDSIWVEEVETALTTFQPDVIVTNSGGAVFAPFENNPILMNEEETVKVAKAAPQARIIAVHMESLDHCKVTRSSLRQKAEEADISPTQLLIPADMEVIAL